MGKRMFNRGYESARKEKERQDKARENAGKRLFRFFIANDGEEVDIKFLTSEPVTFQEHQVKETRNGKEIFASYTCPQDDTCQLCDEGDRSSFKGAFLVYDSREFEVTDSNGKKKKVRGSIKLFVYGTKVLSQLDRIATRKNGLLNLDVTMVRLGSGTSTTYTFETESGSKLTSKEIESLLPEKLRKEYDGTEDSLYSIIEEQLQMNIKGYTPDDSEDDNSEEEEEEPVSRRSKIMGSSDDTDDEDNSPVRKKKSLFRKVNAENSVKKQSDRRSLLRRDSEDEELPFN